MPFTLFGILWLLFLAYAFIKKGTRYMIMVTLFSMIFQCNNVIDTGGGLRVGPQLVTSLVFILHCIVSRNYARIDTMPTRIRSVFFFLFLFVIYVFFSIIDKNIYNQHILQLIQFSVYIICGLAMYKRKNYFSVSDMDQTVYRMTVFTLCVGVVQFLATSYIIPKLGIIEALLYNDHTEGAVYYHVSWVYRRVLSTFMEPSYFSTYITGMFFYIFYRMQHFKHAKRLLAAIVVELVLTFSSTGYLITAAVGVFFAIYVDNKKIRNIFLGIGILLGIYLVFIDTSVLDEVIFKKMESSSGTERDKWNVIAMELFAQNPLTGVGFKEWRASSFAVAMLCENGIIGAFIYLLFYFSLFLPLLNKSIKEAYSQEIASRFFVLSVALGQIIACPDIELCTMWLGFYMVMLTINKHD